MECISILGYHTALLLCSKGYQVTIACRNEERALQAQLSITEKIVSFRVFDFVFLFFICELRGFIAV